ncbi:MAG: glycosyl transferase family 2 [Cyanothece sp. SIO1E1]|nr:glycosyl transferase family 2 [Cyanothece sp. SIO1E1]
MLLAGSVLIVPYGDFYQAGAVPKFWLGIGVMSLGFWVSWTLRSVKAVWFWGVAIATRLLLLQMYPGDDVWRYLWEGYIQTLGFSPYHLAPTAAELVPFHTEWWSLINHPDVTAIYPPITQFGFRILAAITPSVLLFKSAIVLADLWVCWLLSRRFGYLQTTIYAWNPLIIYTFAGGAHYDSWFLLPLVATWLVFDSQPDTEPATPGKPADDSAARSFAPLSCWRSLVRWAPLPQDISRWLKSALLLGISVATKWISLPILGFLTWQALRRAGLKLALIVLFCGSLPLVLSAIPFCYGGECPLIPTGSVFVSHGRSAELIPHIVGKFWKSSLDHNWYYLFPLGVAGGWLVLRSRNFGRFAEGYFFALLVISPIIHAWYVTWLVPFAVATQNLGTRLLSLSIFVYFLLPYRLSLGNYDWYLTNEERWLLWTPFILGWLWTLWQQHPPKSSLETVGKL